MVQLEVYIEDALLQQRSRWGWQNYLETCAIKEYNKFMTALEMDERLRVPRHPVLGELGKFPETIELTYY